MITEYFTDRRRNDSFPKRTFVLDVLPCVWEREREREREREYAREVARKGRRKQEEKK